MKKELWLSNKIIFKWPFYLQGCSITLNNSNISRSYQIWERANTLIKHSKNDFDLSDGVLGLKRSLDKRLKSIENIYLLKDKNIFEKPKYYLDILEHLKIIRPLFFHKLLKIRNEIEHQDKKPPSKEECIEFADVIWYFLKSTDAFVYAERNCFEGDDGEYGYNLDVDYKKDTMKIRGWFPSKYISETYKQNYFKVIAKEIKGKSDFVKTDIYNYHKKRLEDDVYLNGFLSLNSKELLEFYRKVFNLYF